MALVARAQHGDNDAWSTLYQAHMPRLIRYLQWYGCDDPENVAHDVWEKVIKGLPTFRDDGSPFWCYLMVIARNQAAKQFRSQTARLDVVYSPIAYEHAEGPPMEQTAMGRVFAQHLITQLSDPRMREVMELKMWHDLNFKEIAERLDTWPVTVRDYYNRALLELRDILQVVVPPEHLKPRNIYLSRAQKQEIQQRFVAGESAESLCAAFGGVPMATMTGIISGLKRIICILCAQSGRPGNIGSPVCAACYADLAARGERWCAYNAHIAPIGKGKGYCDACMHAYSMAYREKQRQARRQHGTRNVRLSQKG